MEIVDALPVAYGTANACGIVMGGVWLSAEPGFIPLLLRQQFPLDIQRKLVTYHNKSGTISNSDLELAAQLASHNILVQQYKCQEHTISTFTDNVSARAWQHKGSKTMLHAPNYLLRLHSLHQRFHRYCPTIDYLTGPINAMADDTSHLWHCLITNYSHILILLTHKKHLGPFAT